MYKDNVTLIKGKKIVLFPCTEAVCHLRVLTNNKHTGQAACCRRPQTEAKGEAYEKNYDGTYWYCRNKSHYL